MIESRLEQSLQLIDEKLDRLVEQVTRMDERIDGARQRGDRLEYRLDLLEDRVNGLDQTLAAQTGKGMMMERAAWVVFTAAVAALAKFL